MIKKATTLALLLVIVTSCVSPKVYKELEGKYSNLKKENKQISEENELLLSAKTAAENELKQLKEDYETTLKQRNRLQTDYDATKSNFDNLQASYKALEDNSSSAIAANSKKNRELLAQLEAKEQALASENDRLNNLKRELESGSQRISELERVIAAKDAALTNLKDAISRALTDFEGKGLTIEQRNGKVYVSLENKLLFNSGSWTVGTEGRKAVQQLGSVLGTNPDIAVLIEGHTDNVPYGGTGQIKGNWDLSTKRATAIVTILRENSDINAENLTAAGRGEFAPVSTNDTAEGKAKNRRIEVILTPKLDQISKLLNDI